MVAASAKAVSGAWTDAASVAAPGLGTSRDAQLRLLLAGGGDERLFLDPVTRRNRYGVPAGPAPDELWFSSSTASAISPRGWTAASEALERLMARDPAARTPLGAWLDDMRARILAHYGVPGCEAVLSASGSEAEFLVLAFALSLARGPVVNIVVAPAETGSGVPAAAAGRHFLGRSSLGGPVVKGERLAGWNAAEVETRTLEIRTADGRLRSSADVDRDAEAEVERAVRSGAFVLLHVLDASKTGRSGVSRQAARQILEHHPGKVMIAVDACQLRCAAAQVRADLEDGFVVMLTGSKFAGGPSFCGAVLAPAPIVKVLSGCEAGAALADYSAALDWPAALRPVFAARLRHPANLGLGLRWSAALAEIDAFEALAACRRDALVAEFDQAVRARVAATRGLALLDTDEPLGAPGLTPIVHTDAADARAVYAALQQPDRAGVAACHLGQPVVVGARTALRVCASMPMIIDAAARGIASLEADLDRLFDAWATARARA